MNLPLVALVTQACCFCQSCSYKENYSWLFYSLSSSWCEHTVSPFTHTPVKCNVYYLFLWHFPPQNWNLPNANSAHKITAVACQLYAALYMTSTSENDTDLLVIISILGKQLSTWSWAIITLIPSSWQSAGFLLVSSLNAYCSLVIHGIFGTRHILENSSKPSAIHQHFAIWVCTTKWF